MRVYILFCHPSAESFCSEVLQAFIRGLSDAGHIYEIADLYRMRFDPLMDEVQYRREVSWIPGVPVPDDVARQQEKVLQADVLAFIYPVWWSDCPAMLKGWFDRVWTYGYAYYYDADNTRGTQITVKKALVLCSAGHTAEYLEETGIAQCMRQIMLNDRLLGIGVKEAQMEILGGMLPGSTAYREENLRRAYELGKTL
jgi:NAD(P)H dehydrogenase (quinone)